MSNANLEIGESGEEALIEYELKVMCEFSDLTPNPSAPTLDENKQKS